jgi:hypothetical protein
MDHHKTTNDLDSEIDRLQQEFYLRLNKLASPGSTDADFRELELQRNAVEALEKPFSDLLGSTTEVEAEHARSKDHYERCNEALGQLEAVRARRAKRREVREENDAKKKEVDKVIRDLTKE